LKILTKFILLLLLMLMVFVQLHEHEHEHELLLVVAPCGAATGDWICYNKLNGFLQVQFARIF
jgi:fumarate reductase subunit D